MSVTAERARDATAEDVNPVVPMVLRGEVVESDLIEFTGRGDSLTFLGPDPRIYMDRIPLSSPSQLSDLHELAFEEILDFLQELGERLDIATNEHMQWARQYTYATAPRTQPLIDNEFNGMRRVFDRDRIRQRAERTVGLAHLNGWVESRLDDGTEIAVRAFGARGLHIIPGNGAAAVAETLIRCAFTRSDCIMKTPSNNPFAAVAIGRTMCEMAPQHPITKHTAIAYWRGGDEELERRLYQPHNIEKIIAWGGFASVKHVTRYIQPGLELISLDPKYSGSVVGGDALTDEHRLREAALRIAVDVGTGNQVGCSSSRFVYVVGGDGAELANHLADLVYEELVALPDGLSTKPKSYDSDLRSNVEAVRLQDDWYKVVGGEDGEGCVIVSQLADPVDFSSLMADRTVNIVPVETIEEVLRRFDSYTQTVGVYPEELKKQLVDVAPFYGVQRFVSLGYSSAHTGCAPHDGLELERRMCKWVVDQRSEPIPVSFAAEGDRVGPDRNGWTAQTLDAVRKSDGNSGREAGGPNDA